MAEMIPTNLAKPHRQTGSTLVEFVLGTFVVVAMLGAILSVCIQHAKLEKLDGELNLALVASRNSLEEIRSVPFTDLPALDGVGFDVRGPNGSPGGLMPVPGDKDGLPGQISVTVQKTANGEILYRIRAAVTWTGALKRQDFQLETLVAERK